MWLPRRAASRGEAKLTPSGASAASVSAIAYCVIRTDFSRTAGRPTVSIRASMSRMGSIPITGGVPLMKRRMPGCGSYSGPIANGSLLPIQPQIGCWKDSWCSART